MWRLIKFATGVNLLDLTVEGLLGNYPKERIDFEIVPFETEFLCAQSNEVLRKELFKDIKPYDYIQWYYDDGDIIHKINGYMEKCGYVIRKTN